MNADQLAEVEVTLREAMKNLRRVDSESGTTFVGSIEVEGREAVAGMLLDHSFPLQLPVVALEPWDTLGFLPHISPKGNVCYLDSEGMILDGSRPGAIVADALDRSIKLLSGGIKGENLSDFVDEFDAYWSYLPDPLVAWSVLDVGTDVCEIVLAIEEGRPDYIGKAEQQIESFIHSDGYEHTLSYQKALYLPLEPNTMLIPPRFDRPLWTAYETRKIAMSHLSEENRMRLRSLTRRRPRAEETVVFSLPRPSGGHSVFGLRFAGLGRHHPLHENGVAHEVRPVRSSRVDRDFMAGRGGATTVLEGKQVLLVGCGSVGGRIAWELARSGALNLTIVDDDFLTPDNTFRHVLGRHYWYINKALALKQELEKQIPYLPIEAIPGRIEELIEDGSVDFGRYGLLVFAVGNPTVELAMNQTIRSLANPPRTVFTWLEPLGIGGHALLVQPGVRGCYGCLFADSRDDPDGMFNKSAFAARGQKFGRALNGCGSMHTPYGSLDAASTANLAVRLALDALTGREAGSPLRSWKGDPGQFVSEGYALSNRFGLSDKELLDYRFAYVSESCQVCGTGFKGGQPVLVR